MKRVSNFLDKAPLWQVYIAGWFCSAAIVASMFYGFPLIGETNPEIIINGKTCIEIGAMSGLLFGLMFTLMMSMMRKSQVFWEYFKEVEDLIDEAETQDALNSIFQNQFQELRKKCQGGPQIPELNRLYTIMKTKHKYVKIKE